MTKIFHTVDQQIVFDELTKINPKLGEIYYSGIFVLNDKDNIRSEIPKNNPSESISDNINLKSDKNLLPKNFVENSDRIAQSAHSMRETLNILLRLQTISKSSGDEITQIEQLRIIYDPHNLICDFPLRLYKEIHKLHGYFTCVSHHSWITYNSHHICPPSEEEYLTKLEQFTSLIKKLLTSHYQIIEEIDKFLKISTPTKSNLNALELLISKNISSYNYFFKHAKSNWLDILVEDGKYFKNIPKVIQKDNLFQTPWFDSYYLDQIAAKKPKQVQKIISNIHISKNISEQNLNVLTNFASAATKMPPKIGKIIAEKAIKEKWYGFPHMSPLSMTLVDLMMNLKDDEFKTSLNLCCFLLDLDNSLRKVYSLIDRYLYEEILKQYVPILLEQDSDAVILVLCNKLSKANTLHNKGSKKLKQKSNEDVSFIWRPAIEDHEQNYNFDLRSYLVSSIRDALEKSENVDVKSLKKSLSLLTNFNYHIFRRLELYFYGRHSKEFNDEINKLVIEYFGNSNFKHEYYYMLQNCYSHLTCKNQKRLLDIISNGPRFNDYSGSKDGFEIHKKYWRIEKLSPIIEYLPDLQDEYNSLVKQYGKSNLIDFAIYHDSSSPVTYSSDLSEDMNIDQVFDFIKSYHTHQGFFIEEDVNAQVFANLVETNPGEYLKHIPELLECPELFHFRFLFGLSKVKNKELDWDAILTFLEHIIIESPSKEIKILDRILYYGSELLEKNLVTKSSKIPFNLRNRIWKLLEKSIEMAPPDTSLSDGYPEKNWDAYTISINSAIGKIGHTIMQYSIWCYYELKTSEFTPIELEPEIKKLFDSLLDPRTKQSISFYAVLGFSFYNLLILDEKWAKSKIDSIFTHNEQNKKAGDAAWDAYLFNQIYTNSFNALFDEYVYRITHFKNIEENIQEQLAKHIGIFYLYSLEQSDKLLEILLKTQNQQLIDNCIIYIGRTLKKWDCKKNLKIDLVKFLSYSKINSNPNIGWLFLNPLMSRKKRIFLLKSTLDKTNGKISPLYLIPQELELFSKEYPLETLECVEKILQYYETTEIYSLLRHIENIFQLIIDIKTDAVIEKINQIVNLLGTLEYDQFRKFFKKR